MLEESQTQYEQKGLPKSASAIKQIDQNQQTRKEKYGGRLYQDSLINKLDPFGDVNTFSYLPRSTFTHSGSMSLRSYIQKQNVRKANNHSKNIGPEEMSVPISERENQNLNSYQNRNLPISNRSPKKNIKESSNGKSTNIPASLIMPPILYDESEMNKPDESAASNKEETYEANSELEITLRHLTSIQLQKQYKALVQRYISSRDQFQALMKKKEKTTHILEQLQKNVNELEAEQQIVEEEYKRLGLGTPQPKVGSDIKPNPNMESLLEDDDTSQENDI